MARCLQKSFIFTESSPSLKAKVWWVRSELHPAAVNRDASYKTSSQCTPRQSISYSSPTTGGRQ